MYKTSVDLGLAEDIIVCSRSISVTACDQTPNRELLFARSLGKVLRRASVDWDWILGRFNSPSRRPLEASFLLRHQCGFFSRSRGKWSRMPGVPQATGRSNRHSRTRLPRRQTFAARILVTSLDGLAFSGLARHLLPTKLASCRTSFRFGYAVALFGDRRGASKSQSRFVFRAA